ncbi:dimethylamine monooxygenase subunit DmmA family protein [Nocardioides sp. CPCC 205120]|uniref:dimethylamine monooxygenase subunit DmmA family protein n=1 Tax=Nocardioides sp. CPCC 205120 TaxID=3406462 RepID=UPI003B504F58
MGEQVLGLPVWPAEPEPVDAGGTSYLVVALGTAARTAEVAAGWVRAAEGRAPTRLVVADDLGSGREDLLAALGTARTGVRIMVVGGVCGVLGTLALARSCGAGEAELRSFAVDGAAAAAGEVVDLPVYCAHCRAPHRVRATYGGAATCPGCARHLEIHPHLSASQGSFLASDARARELV